MSAHAQTPPDAPVEITVATPEEAAAPEPVSEAAPSLPVSTEDSEGFGDSEASARVAADDIGFGDGPTTPVVSALDGLAPATGSTRSELSASGFVRSDHALWAERLRYQPWAKSRQSLDLSLRYRYDDLRLVATLYAAYDLAYLVDQKRYDASTLNEYRTQVFAKDTYASYTHRGLGASFGRQVVAWGAGDLLSPVDVLSPRDDREPGTAALSDLRLPLLVTRLWWSIGQHRLELLGIHEANFGLRSPVFGPFNPLAALFGGSLAAAAQVQPALAADDAAFVQAPRRFDRRAQQVGARWDYAGRGFDTALYVASVRDQFGVVTELRLAQAASVNAQGADPEVERTVLLRLLHPRYVMLGHSGRVAIADLQLRWELGAKLGRHFNTGPVDPRTLALRDQSRDELFGMLGATYSGVPNTDLVVEAQKSQLLGDGAALLFPFARPAFAFRSRTVLMREKITLESAFVGFGGTLQYGWLARVEGRYAFSDALSANVGYVTYHSGSEYGFLAGFDRHDRVLAGLRYDFLLASGGQ